MYYMFNEPALNGFSPKLPSLYINNSKYHLTGQIPIPVYPLREILDSYIPQDTEIDFLTIDCEGLDLEVLRSNDWHKYRPKVILVESWETDITQITQNPIYTYLNSQHYELYAKLHNTLFFTRQDV